MIRSKNMLAAFLIGLAACGNDDATQLAQNARATAPSVEVQPATRGSIARQATVSGTVEPLRTIGVNAQVAGPLISVNVEEGDRVSEGSVLARVDNRELEAQLAAAEASYEVAQAAFERAEQLRERRVITLPEYERDRTAHAAAKALVDQLRTRAEYTTITAPAAGVITEKRVESGDIVANQTPLFTIADMSQLVVRVGVSELDVVELAQGDPVRITLDALPNRQLSGRIRRIFPVGDATTRLVPVEVMLDAEAARHARPGFLARVTFDLATSNNVLLIPVGAVLGGQGAQAVFIVQNNTAIRRTVSTGLVSEGRVEIVAGLNDGELVVVTGQNRLRDGMTVRAVGGSTEVSPSSASPAAAQVPAGASTTEPPAAAPRS